MNLSPGDKLYGFCSGYFGRDSYEDKVVLAAGENRGVLWITAVNAHGHILLAQGMSADDVERWKRDDDVEDPA
ncbi:hypothetical protein [Microbacterium sp. T32]|uniref:hypothetical protein n=1 Tax=Microbacterium sp. T32 TaxID=1776083 RepID=UPI0007AB2E1C|nr:hypothetical protein [Microbacterium sp. T32]KZE41442.1 hypothetical protein AVW09_02300 [Microbacterium sp. T32]